MIVTQSVNVHLDKQTIPALETVQSDTGRAVKLALFSQGTSWSIPSGATGTVRYSIFHDGECYTSVYDNLSDGSAAVSCSGNVLTVSLTPEVLSIVGVGQLQVELRSGNLVIATLSVLLRVQRDLSLEGVTPAARTSLTHQIQDEVFRQTQAIYDQGSWLETLHHRVDAAFTAGALNSGDGTEVDSTTRIRTGFLSHGGREITVTVPVGIKARCFFYDNSQACTSASSYYTDTFTIHNSGAYVRIVAGYADDGTVEDAAALAAQVGIFYPSDGFDDYRGHVKALGFDSFAQCNAPGYYRFAGTDVANISDAPAITVGGILRVHTHGSTNVVFQTILTSDGQIWFRWGSHSFARLLPKGEKLRWYSLGDSIAQGYYSDSEGLKLDESLGWAALAAKYNGWSLTNKAVGGSGYVQPATVGDGLNARDHVDTIDFSNAELVTLAFGVNDWKGNCPLGSMSDDVATGGTFYSNMRYCIEKILSTAPHVKIAVISPLNCCAYGTKGGNWGAGYAFAGGKLEDFSNAAKEICAYYGIEFVDALHGSIVNRENAQALLPDGVHPTLDCHRMLAVELSRKLMTVNPPPQPMVDDTCHITVTANEDGYDADNDVYDIMTADQEGLKCVCHWGAVQLPMVRLENELAVFSAVLDGMEYRVEFRPDNVAAVSEELSLRQLNFIDPGEFTEQWFLNNAVGTAIINDGWTSSVNNTHGVYPVEDGENVAFSSTVKVGIYLYDTDGVLRSYALYEPSPVVSCSVEGYTIGYLGIVAGAPAGGIVACRGYDENYLPAYLQLAQEGYVIQQREAHDYIAGKRLDALDKKIAGTAPGFTLNWYALGDSITEGIYGYVSEDGSTGNAKDAANCWAALAAKYNNWTLTNKGIGGTGYVSKGKSGALTNARELVDATDFSSVDLVTLAYGVNDWMHNVSLGAFDDDIATGGTIYSNMRYCVEKILSTAPHVKVVVISPLNCAGQGDFSTNWGAGVAFSNSGTLEDIYAAQKEICTYYGIEFIDMLHSSVVNRLNIESVLPDKVHPSTACHIQLARELSRKLMG